ncbi:Hpt domain-containing protein [Marinomonas sp. THO17]|uniref:Hpt domain-containing protein n=1 Tax=Marinomonas sp. THO17 TaxID=3149048 RepID=UPI00336BB706
MIDTAYLDSLTQLLGKNTVNQIRLEFVKDSSQKLELLLTAWQEQDYQQLKQVSHSLKSASLNMAANQLAEQCAIIEAASANEQASPIAAAIELLPTLHKETLAVLSDYFSMLS